MALRPIYSPAKAYFKVANVALITEKCLYSNYSNLVSAIDDFMAALSSNAELRQAIANSGSADDAVKLAAAAGYEITTQDLSKHTKAV